MSVAWTTRIEGLELRNPPFPVEVYLVRDSGLVIEVRVPDREHGGIITVCHPFALPYLAVPIEEYVYGCLERVFIHELRECFHWRGFRVKDPHQVSTSGLSRSGVL